MSSSSTIKQFWALAFLCSSSLVLISASFFLFEKLVQANNSAHHSMKILQEAQQTMLNLVECETSCAGYLINGDKKFIEPYDNCQQNVFDHLNKLKDLLKADHSREEIMMPLYRLASETFELRKTIIKSRPQNIDYQFIELSLRKGKAIMDEFKNTIKQILSSEEIILDRKQHYIKHWRLGLLCGISLSGAVILLFLIWICVTNRRYEQEQAAIKLALNQARDEAITANKLKSQFVANVSHEIRTPLSGILGLSELLTSSELTPEASELVSHIHISAQSLVSLVNQILDFSRLDASKLELYFSRFTLSEVVEKVLASCKIEAESKGLKLHTHIETGLEELELYGDSGRLRQVLLNLLYNAIKFTATGSVNLTITKEHDEGTQILIRFEIADTGIGINEKSKESLFEPFVQADGSTTRKYGGTGLGLSICLNLVHLMRGTIDCAKNVEGGATFWFTVPFENSFEKNAETTNTNSAGHLRLTS